MYVDWNYPRECRKTYIANNPLNGSGKAPVPLSGLSKFLSQKRRALLRVREKPDIPLWYSVIGGCRPANRETTSNCVRDHPRACVRTCIEIVLICFWKKIFYKVKHKITREYPTNDFFVFHYCRCSADDYVIVTIYWSVYINTFINT